MISRLRDVKETYRDIKEMRIRGAGRIARAAAEALKNVVENSKSRNREDILRSLEKAGEHLKSARPTAVSLPNGVNFVLAEARASLKTTDSLEEWKSNVVSAADEFTKLSFEAVERIGEIGSKRITDGDTILTHCNSEAATRIITKAHEAGKDISVIVTETRPRFQGRLTASLLARRGIKTTLIIDAAARLYMGKVDKVIFGADAIAANGAVVNKIGTAQISLAAKEARARVFVGAESYKLSPQTFLGELVEIEERSSIEVAPAEWIKKNPAISVRNPAFDVTPPEYIDLIITERGVYPPQGVVMLLKELYQ